MTKDFHIIANLIYKSLLFYIKKKDLFKIDTHKSFFFKINQSIRVRPQTLYEDYTQYHIRTLQSI